MHPPIYQQVNKKQCEMNKISQIVQPIKNGRGQEHLLQKRVKKT